MISEEFQERVGPRIRQYRRHRALSVEQLAAQSLVDAGTISRAENKLTQITLDSAIRICRALSISLTQLVFDKGASNQSDAVFGERGPESSGFFDLSHDDVTALLSVFRSSEDRGKELLTKWANDIMQAIGAKESATRQYTIMDREIEVILSDNPAFQFRVRYPEDGRLWAIETIYHLGGELGRREIPLLYLAITDDNERYRLLDKQDRELLRRLHSGTPDRVRLFDVLHLQEVLDIDLLGIYDRAEGLHNVGESADILPNNQDPLDTRIISLFVALCSWLRSLDNGNDRWLQAVRNDIDSAQKTTEGAPDRVGG